MSDWFQSRHGNENCGYGYIHCITTSTQKSSAACGGRTPHPAPCTYSTMNPGHSGYKKGFLSSTVRYDSGLGASLNDFTISCFQTSSHKPQLVNIKDAEQWRCPVCKEVLRQPMQTACGHRLCESCLEDLLARNNSPRCPVGDQDCVVLSMEEVYQDYGGRKDLSIMPVYCINRSLGCQAEVPWNTLEEHIENCDFMEYNCPFNHEGCEEKGFNDFMKAHVEDCPFHSTDCSQCSDNMDKLKAQWEKQLKKPVACNFSHLTCLYVGTLTQLSDHKVTAMLSHMQMIQVTFEDITHRNIEFSSRILIVHKDFQDLREQGEVFHSKHSKVIENTNSLKTKIGIVQNMVEHNSRTVGKMEEEKQSCAQKDDLLALRRDLHYLLKISVAVNEKLPVHEGPVAHVADGSRESHGLISNVRKQEHILAQLRDRLSKGDERLQFLEAIGYNGVLIWKITKYSQLKSEARFANSRVLISRPFFTSRHGYKLKAKVFLNGDGVGKDSHMSLFITIVKGEFDALLPWPFQQRVTLMVLDQAGGGAHIQETFRPDPGNTSFFRPQGDANPSCGCPMFAPHDLLEAEGSPYIKQDTLFLKIVVDVEN